MLNGSWTSSAGRVGSDCLLDFWSGIRTGIVARRFPPAPSFPCIDIVCTARHACKPPRAATFFSTIAAAESLVCEEVSPPAAARETANASDIEIPSDFRNIDATSFKDLRLGLELRIGSNRISFFAQRQAPGASLRRLDGARETLIHHKSVSSKLSNHHTYAVSAFHQSALVRERHPVRHARLRCAALTQLPDLFHRRDHQLDLSLRVDQQGLGLLIVECLGFVRV